MEIKVEVEKDGVAKSVTENLVSDYLHMGWKLVEKKEKKLEEESPKLSFRKSLKD